MSPFSSLWQFFFFHALVFFTHWCLWQCNDTLETSHYPTTYSNNGWLMIDIVPWYSTLSQMVKSSNSWWLSVVQRCGLIDSKRSPTFLQKAYSSVLCRFYTQWTRNVWPSHRPVWDWATLGTYSVWRVKPVLASQRPHSPTGSLRSNPGNGRVPAVRRI